MFQFSAFPPVWLWIHHTVTEVSSAGFPHSDIHGSLTVCISPWHFAAFCVLLRLLAPRHSPFALFRLTFPRSQTQDARCKIKSKPVCTSLSFPAPSSCFQLLFLHFPTVTSAKSFGWCQLRRLYCNRSFLPRSKTQEVRCKIKSKPVFTSLTLPLLLLVPSFFLFLSVFSFQGANREANLREWIIDI